MQLNARGQRTIVTSKAFPSASTTVSDNHDELSNLQREVDAFLALEGSEAAHPELYHRVLAAVHRLCASIVVCEEAGIGRQAIVDVLEPVRRIHAQAPFVRRLQEWPRGYAGDFETVEYLCSGARRRREMTIPGICEAYSLTRSIAQQHRNKVQEQASRILRALLEHPGTARIFSIACGSSPDLRSISAHLPALLGDLYLNDSDADALAFSAGALQSVAERCHTRLGNAIKVARRMEQDGKRFHLVLAGGLFDYLPEKAAIYLIEHAWSLLEQGGTFFFTNIAEGNPYRPLIEYFGDWFLIERSEDDLHRYCEAAGIPRSAVTITREETGLTFLIDVKK